MMQLMDCVFTDRGCDTISHRYKGACLPCIANFDDLSDRFAEFDIVLRTAQTAGFVQRSAFIACRKLKNVWSQIKIPVEGSRCTKPTNELSTPTSFLISWQITIRPPPSYLCWPGPVSFLSISVPANFQSISRDSTSKHIVKLHSSNQLLGFLYPLVVLVVWLALQQNTM